MLIVFRGTKSRLVFAFTSEIGHLYKSLRTAASLNMPLVDVCIRETQLIKRCDSSRRSLSAVSVAARNFA